MCLAPQRRALFRHLKCQKWSENGAFCTFWLGNVLRATTACIFSTSQLPKVVRTPSVFNILAWKCAWRRNGVQFFISPLASWLRTRCFSEPTFRPSGPPNHWKITVNRDFPTLSRISIFFLLTLSFLLFSLLIFLFSLPLPCSAFHLSILSEVWLLNFLRPCFTWLRWNPQPGPHRLPGPCETVPWRPHRTGTALPRRATRARPPQRSRLRGEHLNGSNGTRWCPHQLCLFPHYTNFRYISYQITKTKLELSTNSRSQPGPLSANLNVQSSQARNCIAAAKAPMGWHPKSIEARAQAWSAWNSPSPPLARALGNTRGVNKHITLLKRLSAATSFKALGAHNPSPKPDVLAIVQQHQPKSPSLRSFWCQPLHNFFGYLDCYSAPSSLWLPIFDPSFFL